MEASEYPKVTVGEGYAVARDLDALGEGYGFRKMRKGLGVTAFGVNVMDPSTRPAAARSGHNQGRALAELLADSAIDSEALAGARTAGASGPGAPVRSVSFRVGPGQSVGLIGANGAGKTSTLKALMGLVPCAGGQVRFGDADLRMVS